MVQLSTRLMHSLKNPKFCLHYSDKFSLLSHGKGEYTNSHCGVEALVILGNLQVFLITHHVRLETFINLLKLRLTSFIDSLY